MRQAPRRDVLFQVSTINALLAGVYDGDLTVGELKQHGDLGIGTLEAVDGEMVVLAGKAWLIRADGHAYRLADSDRTPFAAVTFFEPDATVQLNETADLAGLQSALDAQLPNKNLFYAVRIDGEFAYAKTRSVPRQSKPYPPLAEVAKTQPVFEFRDVNGTLVGFRCPDFVEGVNVPGWHLHFLTAARTAGGHLLDCRVNHAEAKIDETPEFALRLPLDDSFARADLATKRAQELNKVEK
ncbi:MAG: acetolactate decarboxylase [Candidatus Sumerlaeota bacterium]|nr:acetolactate decarboxylase [Candidatus Sumerlaeota bacterium]